MNTNFAELCDIEIITIDVTLKINPTMCVVLETNKLIHNFPNYG